MKGDFPGRRQSPILHTYTPVNSIVALKIQMIMIYTNINCVSEDRERDSLLNGWPWTMVIRDNMDIEQKKK